MTQQTGSFIWYELMTSDPDAAARFYGAVVGWTAPDSGTPGMDYRLWSMGGVPVGGLMKLPAGAAEGGMPPIWASYLHVADVDAATTGITAVGGRVHMPPASIPGVGRIAMLADPQGALFYVMAPAGEGPSVSFASGKPGHCGWNELRTGDSQAALEFYGAQFGWTRAGEMDMGPMGTYRLFGAGNGEMVGGMMNQAQQPPHWLYYFNVEAIDPAAQRVTEAGGEVLHGPNEVPGEMWVIHAMDPQGARFGLLAPRRAA